MEVSENLTVVNIIGQQGIYSRNGRPPIRYSYLQRGLLKVGLIAKEKDAEVVEFARFEKGEGIEKKEENFAEEVMNQLK